MDFLISTVIEKVKEKAVDAAFDSAEDYVKNKFKKAGDDSSTDNGQQLSALNNAEQTKLLKQQQDLLRKQEERLEQDDLWQQFQKQMFLAEKGAVAAQYKLATFYRDGKGIEKDQEEALKWFEKAAEQGNGDAVDNLISFHSSNKSTEAATSAWLAAAAEKGNANAQILLGTYYANGLGVAKDVDEALRLYKLAAAKQNVDALFALGTHYFDGIGVEKDESVGVKYWSKLTPDFQGFTPVQIRHVACAYLEGIGGVQKHTDAAVRWMTKAADKGDLLALCYKGHWKHERGSLMKKDAKEAYSILKTLSANSDSEVQAFFQDKKLLDWIELFEERNAFTLAQELDKEQKYEEALPFFVTAAKRGYFQASYEVGLYYSTGRVSSPDSNTLALSYFRDAAEKGLGVAELKMGTIYRDGLLGVEKSNSLAVQYLSSAAVKDIKEAKRELGSLYFIMGKEHFSAKNYREVLRWYRLAAKEGDVNAHHELGRMYESGIGVVRNLSKALNHYAMALNQPSIARIDRQCKISWAVGPIWNQYGFGTPCYLYCCVGCCMFQPLSSVVYDLSRDYRNQGELVDFSGVACVDNCTTLLSVCTSRLTFIVPIAPALVVSGDCIWCSAKLAMRGCCCCEWPVEFCSQTEAELPPEFSVASSP
ncbi:sel1 repeat family protein [archaeon]|nr:MAG: sel1 repeat family protein [archaeon]